MYKNLNGTAMLTKQEYFDLFKVWKGLAIAAERSNDMEINAAFYVIDGLLYGTNVVKK